MDVEHDENSPRWAGLLPSQLCWQVETHNHRILRTGWRDENWMRSHVRWFVWIKCSSSTVQSLATQTFQRGNTKKLSRTKLPFEERIWISRVLLNNPIYCFRVLFITRLKARNFPVASSWEFRAFELGEWNVLEFPKLWEMLRCENTSSVINSCFFLIKCRKWRRPNQLSIKAQTKRSLKYLKPVKWSNQQSDESVWRNFVFGCSRRIELFYFCHSNWDSTWQSELQCFSLLLTISFDVFFQLLEL